MIENSLRQRFRVFATFKVFIGHHHRALFPHATTSVDFELRHRLTKQIDYQTLKKCLHYDVTSDRVLHLRNS